MKPVHICGVAELPLAEVDHRSEAELVQAVTAMALADARLERSDIGFTCSGSSDYVMGRPFSFVMALDGIGAWPPIRESHVEMDGAWALYEAFIRLQHGDVDTALVYSFGKSSVGSVDAVNALQLDPYTLAPLGVPVHAIAGLQLQALRDVGVDAELEGARRHDGAAAVVLRLGGGGPRIAGIDHRIDMHDPGLRDLTRCPSAEIAGREAGTEDVEIAHLHARWSHEETLLARALNVDCTLDSSRLRDVPMVSGLANIGRAARSVQGGVRRALGHASQGPCLQQNLVCVVEAA